MRSSSHHCNLFFIVYWDFCLQDSSFVDFQYRINPKVYPEIQSDSTIHRNAKV